MILSSNFNNKMSGLKSFEDITSDEKNFDTDEDIEKLKKLKEVSQTFLKVNNFDISNEPNIEELSEDQFIEYITKTSSNLDILLNIFKELKIDINLRSLMSNYYTHKEDETNKIFVLFIPNDKSKANSTSKSDFKKFITIILKLDCREGLLLSEKDLSSKSKEQVKKCNTNIGTCDNIYRIITYKDEEFIDITKHAFIPKVIKILRQGKDTEQFALENNINIKKLSKMTLNDPLSKFYRARVGDIFHMVRQNLGSKSILNEQIIFRIVVPAIIKKK